MFDYVDGKVDWMAYGLPVEGEDGPFLGGAVAETSTCDAGQTVADARRALGDGADGMEVLVLSEGLVVGAVDATGLEGVGDDAALLDVMQPVPSTVRPSVPLQSVVEDGGGSRVVTTSDGRLLGRATVDADDGHDDHDDHDDHEGHDHGDADAYEAELTSIMLALQERFGESEPSAEEVHAFLRERLLSEGWTPEDADALLAELVEGDPPDGTAAG